MGVLHPDPARLARRAEARTDVVLAAVVGISFILVLALLPWMLPRSNFDIRVWYLPWYQHIVSHGRLASLEASYADYNPPYLYLLSAFTLLDGTVLPVVVLKLVQLPAMLAMGVLGWSLCRAVGATQKRAVLAGCVVLLAPEVVTNALVWGQADTLYTAFLLLMLRLLLSKRWNWAMAAFGAALAVKLQSVFVGPVLVAMLLSGELPWASLLFTLPSYAAFMAPAWFAGRPFKDLLLIYRHQVSHYPKLAMNVANPYQLLMHWLRSSGGTSAYGSSLGLVLGAIGTAGLIIWLARSPEMLRGRLLIASVALPLLLEPYWLPKMHDRYYFAGDVLLVVLATLEPALAIPAVLTQAAVVFTYYLFLSDIPFYPKSYILPVAAMTLGLGMYARWMYVRQLRLRRNNTHDERERAAQAPYGPCMVRADWARGDGQCEGVGGQ